MLPLVHMALQQEGLDASLAVLGYLAGAAQIRWLPGAGRLMVGDPQPLYAITRLIGSGVRIYYSRDPATALEEMEHYLRRFRRMVFVPLPPEAARPVTMPDAKGQLTDQRRYIGVVGLDPSTVTYRLPEVAEPLTMPRDQLEHLIETGLDLWFTLGVPQAWPSMRWILQESIPFHTGRAVYGWRGLSEGLTCWQAQGGSPGLPDTAIGTDLPALSHEWGGGLGRFVCGEALVTAAAVLCDSQLAVYGSAYTELGHRWEAALQNRVAVTDLLQQEAALAATVLRHVGD